MVAAIGKVGMTSVFDLILFVYGIYTIYSAKKMQKDHQVPQWMVAEQERMKIRQPAKFCEMMAPKTQIFGILCILYGVYGMVADVLLKNFVAEMGGIVFFVVIIGWFMSQLNKAKREYM